MSCFGGRDEQIYMIEVLIHKLTLTKNKIKDIGEYPVIVKIKLLDFPVLEINREDFYSLKPPPPAEDGSMQFMIGRCCLFVKRPKDLVRELQSMIKVGVFRLGDTYPVAETEITLPGCLCDQVAMAQNDPANLPKPFTVKGSFNLLDPGENPSGTLEMEMRLLCFGKLIMTHYELHPKFFAFRNSDNEREFCVRRLVPPGYRTDSADKDVSQYPDRTTLDELKGKSLESLSQKGKGKKKGKK